jgi:hypothetical protein
MTFNLNLSVVRSSSNSMEPDLGARAQTKQAVLQKLKEMRCGPTANPQEQIESLVKQA